MITMTIPVHFQGVEKICAKIEKGAYGIIRTPTLHELKDYHYYKSSYSQFYAKALNILDILPLLTIAIIISFLISSLLTLSSPHLTSLPHCSSNLHADLVKTSLRIQGAETLQ